MKLRNTLQKLSAKYLPLLLTTYVILQPVIDVLTSLGTRANMTITVGLVVRTLFMAYAFVYTVFISKFKQKKFVLLYLSLITAYMLAFAIYMSSLGPISYVLANIKETVKTFFFPYVAVYFYAVYKEHNFVISKKTVAITTSLYAGSIFLAYLTGSSFTSYQSGYGYCGWFYAANEISDILSLVSPIAICFALEYIKNNTNMNKKQVCVTISLLGLIFVCIFACTYIGTKVIFPIILVYLILCAVRFIIGYIKAKNNKNIISLIIAILFCVITVCMYTSSPLNDYLSDVYLPIGDETSEEAKLLRENSEHIYNNTILGRMIRDNKALEKLNWLLSQRLIIIATSVEEYVTGDIGTIMLGIGYKNNSSYEYDIEKMIEMDAPAVLCRHGIVGFALIYLPYFALICYFVISFFKKPKHILDSLSRCTYLYISVIGFIISLLIGHTIMSPNVSLFIVFTAMTVLSEIEKQNNQI